MRRLSFIAFIALVVTLVGLTHVKEVAARSVSEILHLIAPGRPFLIRVASRNPMGVGFGFVNYFVFKNHFQ